MPRLRAFSLALAALPFLAVAPAFAQEAYRVGDFAITSPPPAPASSNPGDFFNTDGALCFLASTPSTLRAVWATDGTSAGTELLHYPCVNGCDVDPQFLGHLGRVSFWLEAPSDLSRPNEIWRSDGTRAGTFALSTTRPYSPGTATPSGFLFFNCALESCGFWETDGTVVGTHALLDVYPSTTRVTVALTVTDTQTGAVKVYKNPSGQFGSVADTSAF